MDGREPMRASGRPARRQALACRTTKPRAARRRDPSNREYGSPWNGRASSSDQPTRSSGAPSWRPCQPLARGRMAVQPNRLHVEQLSQVPARLRRTASRPLQSVRLEISARPPRAGLFTFGPGRPPARVYSLSAGSFVLWVCSLWPEPDDTRSRASESAPRVGTSVRRGWVSRETALLFYGLWPAPSLEHVPATRAHGRERARGSKGVPALAAGPRAPPAAIAEPRYGRGVESPVGRRHLAVGYEQADRERDAGSDRRNGEPSSQRRGWIH